MRDYARLARQRRQDCRRHYLIEATDWKRAPGAFQPDKLMRSWGYGYPFWLYEAQTRRFALLGVYGQAIFVDPALKLVIVQTAASATAEVGNTSFGRERNAFWRAILRYYTKP